MRKFILYICVAILSLISCDRDHLYYETSSYALVHIEIDWETLSHIDPNGVSAYIFDSNGERYGSTVLSSDPDNVYLKLPKGEYTVVVHNNSISELNGVHITGASQLDTFSIHANEASYDAEFDTLDDELFVDEPDDVVSYTLRNILITEDDVNYHYDKPDLSEYTQEVAYKYFIQPDHIVHIVQITAYLDGIEYSSSKQPMAVLHGMSGGYYFGAECTSEEDVMEQFEASISASATTPDTPTATASASSSISRTNEAVDILEPDGSDEYTAEELEDLGKVTVNFNTFGMHITDPESQHYFVYLRFYLYDGTYTDYKIDITGYIKTEDTGTNNVHTVEMILSDLQDGGGEPGDGTWGPSSDGDDSGESGVFDPTMDEWIDVDVDVAM